MLHALSPADLGRAANLLIEGFPERSPAFWHSSLERLGRHGGNAAANFPAGFLLEAKDGPAGVVLTPAAIRPGADGRPRRVVNISSWYVRDAQRWRAPAMLKSILREPDAVFTDLTPSPPVRAMLPKFGFQPISRGTIISALPLAAIRRARENRVRALAPHEDPPEIGGQRAFGCHPVMVESAAGRTLVVFRRSRVRQLPAASLVYVGSHRLLAAGFPALARHLVARGFAFLRAPAAGDLVGLGTFVLPTGYWFAIGDTFEDRTDAIGSELTLFDL